MKPVIETRVNDVILMQVFCHSDVPIFALVDLLEDAVKTLQEIQVGSVKNLGCKVLPFRKGL